MEDYLNELARLLEVGDVKPEDELRKFELWDSLTVLALLAFIDEKYSVLVSSLDMADVETASDLYKLIEFRNLS